MITIKAKRNKVSEAWFDVRSTENQANFDTSYILKHISDIKKALIIQPKYHYNGIFGDKHNEKMAVCSFFS